MAAPTTRQLAFPTCSPLDGPALDSAVNKGATHATLAKTLGPGVRYTGIEISKRNRLAGLDEARNCTLREAR